MRVAADQQPDHGPPALGGAQGMASDIEIQAREILRMRQRLNELYAKYTGRKIEAIEIAMDRDKFLESDEAKEFGIIDEVFGTRPPAGEGWRHRGGGCDSDVTRRPSPLRGRGRLAEGERGEGAFVRHVIPALSRDPPVFLFAAMEKLPCVYILAKASHSTLYTGVTSDLPGRVWQQSRRSRPRVHATVRNQAASVVRASRRRWSPQSCARKRVKRWPARMEVRPYSSGGTRLGAILAEDFGFPPLGQK